ncbi:MAG TPA: FtsX-like permease family protein, partial [Terracidiphilus sp.]
RDFAGDRNVLGKKVHIDGVLHTIVGVMPMHFKFPLDWGRAEVWVPIELLSYLVEQRRQEIGIRMALGADRGAVVGMVMRQTLVLMGAGAAIGVGLALWSDRLLEGFLYGVSASDPWTMVIAPLVLVICGLIAALIPARRAASVNPVEALRAE